jgi:gluconate 2-dehydrogenase gamma chain
MASDGADTESTTKPAAMSSRRTFLKVGAGVAGGLAAGAAVAYIAAKPSTAAATVQPLQATSTSSATPTGPTTTAATSSSSSPPSSTSTSQPVAIQFFTPAQVSLVNALAETIIPTDSNGPGATTAGVIFFIDGQLATAYGNNSYMYMEGPFVQPNQTSAITVDGVTYSGGSAPARLTSGAGYQYPATLAVFWRNGLEYLESYANSAYGANFETLSAANQAACLTDLWNNKPTNFQGFTPQAFFSEVHDMVWAGFLTDPLYGGNQGMVGWELIGFTGTNQGNAYGEGYSTLELMLMTKPLRLKPQSLAQFQQMTGSYSLE